MCSSDLILRILARGVLRLRIRQEAKRRFVVARSRALRLCVAMLLWPRPLSVARTAVARTVRPVPAVLTLVTAMAVTRGLGRLRTRSRGRYVLRRASDRIVADDGDALPYQLLDVAQELAFIRCAKRQRRAAAAGARREIGRAHV